MPRVAHAHALAGNKTEARKLLQELKSTEGRYVASPQIALVHLGLREVDEAFDWLNRGIDERSPWIIFLKMDPVYDALRCDPRFQNLLGRAGL